MSACHNRVMPEIFIERPYRQREELFEKIEWVKKRVPSGEYHIKLGHTPEYDPDYDFDHDIETVTATIHIWSDDADRVVTELWFEG